jgi:hypothetical protein
VAPGQEVLTAFLAGHGSPISFRADADGWFSAELVVGEGGPLVVERWLSDEEGIRAELNAWAGFLETCDYSPYHVALMERCIQTRQLFILRKPIDCPDEPQADRLCAWLCQELARQADGFYQADGLGFFEADGTLLVQEH